MHILIVDDSVVFRSQIKSALESYPQVKSINVAANGHIALAKLEQQSIDLIILDLEMPELDGIETLRILRERGFKQHVIVFAATTASGATVALDALKAGATDFVAKPQGTKSLDESLQYLHSELIPRIIQFATRKPTAVSVEKKTPKPHHDKSEVSKVFPNKYQKISVETFKPAILAIGCSTGGPTALDKIFPVLRDVNLRIPIVIVQHMPPVFTANLAKRLSEISGHPAGEGRHGESLKPSHIYVAPGDYHMTLARAGGNEIVIKLDQSPKRNSVRPAVDFLFESCAQIYGGMTASMVLTGMGEDGMQGAIRIKEAHGGVIIQDEETSVVWGMPGSVYNSGAFDQKCSLDQCAIYLRNLVT